MFDHIALIITSPLKPGKISEVVAKLWVGTGAAPPTAPSAAAAAAGAGVKAGFCIPYGEMLND